MGTIVDALCRFRLILNMNLPELLVAVSQERTMTLRLCTAAAVFNVSPLSPLAGWGGGEEEQEVVHVRVVDRKQTGLGYSNREKSFFSVK